MGRGRPRRKVAKARCPEERLAQRIRAQRDLLRASGGRNFDRLAGQNSPVWHTLFLFYLVVVPAGLALLLFEGPSSGRTFVRFH